MDGGLVKEYMFKATETLFPEKTGTSENYRLSANTVAEHVSDLAGDVLWQLKGKCKDFKAYSIAAGERTDTADIRQLYVFI
jgi:hypothetical protein